MFIWGSGHKRVTRDTSEIGVCSACGRTDNLSVAVDYDYSHIYWIFKSVKNVRARLACRQCGQANETGATKDELFSKIGGNPIPFMDRFGGVVLATLVAAGFGTAYLLEAGRDPTGAIVRSGDIDAFEIRLGDCFDDGAAAATEEDELVSEVPGVPCSQPHDNEVFAVYDVELEAYPETDELSDIAFDGCVQRFEAYVGRDYQSSALDVSTLFPTQETWRELNDREVICYLYDIDFNKLEGSMKDSGI